MHISGVPAHLNGPQGFSMAAAFGKVTSRIPLYRSVLISEVQHYNSQSINVEIEPLESLEVEKWIFVTLVRSKDKPGAVTKSNLRTYTKSAFSVKCIDFKSNCHV